MSDENTNQFSPPTGSRRVRDHSENQVVSVDNLVKTYDGTDVVSGIDLRIRRGEIFGLLGPNGAGKTTTLECIVGLRTPTSGTIRVLGFDPAKDRKEITARVSVQPQSATLFETLTVSETLDLFATFYSNPRDPDAVIEQVGLSDKRSVRTKHLSGGQTRRLLLGVALISHPEVIVLDEPSAGLDPAARQSLWSIITGLSDEGITVLLSTHHMDEATSLCHRVGILVSGRIVALDTPNSSSGNEMLTPQSPSPSPQGPTEMHCGSSHHPIHSASTRHRLCGGFT